MEQRALRVAWSRRSSSSASTVSSSQARPGSRISARRRRSCSGPALLDPPEVQRLARRRVTAGHVGRGAARRRRRRGRAARAPRQASGKEYQPFSPPMPSITATAPDGDAATIALCRSGALPPAQSGSVGSGSLGGARERRRGPAGVDVRVADALSRASATRRSNREESLGGVGDQRCDVVLAADRPRAQRLHERPGEAPGTGVTRPTQCADRVGDRTGTGQMMRRGRPASARRSAASSPRRSSTSGPPMSKARLTLRGQSRHARPGSAARRGSRSAGSWCCTHRGVTIAGSRSVR